MNKNVLKVLLAVLIVAFGFTGLSAFAQSTNVVDFLSQDRTVMREGIELHKRTAMTAFNGTLEDKRSQNLQVLIKPSDSQATKVVNWGFQGNSGSWQLATMRNIAKDYEAKHPGWIVLGGVNGDFYGINAPSANYGETNNTMVSDGHVYRPEFSGSQGVLGFRKNGGYVFGHPTFEQTMSIRIYSDLGEVIQEFPIQRINETPGANEIALILNDITNPGSINTTGAKVVDFSNKLYRRTFDNDPSTSRVHNYLVKGIVSEITESTPIPTLAKPEFRVVSRNATFNASVQIGDNIVAHKGMTGAFSDVMDTTGYSHRMLVDGVPQFRYSSDAFIRGPHPRTAVGFRADGSVVLLMIDGRASTEGRNGVSLYELGELLRRYDCVNGFNLDGGGSSSLIVRNDAGDFTTVNYPSDGFDRSVANGLLIVMRDPGIEIEEITESSVKVVNKNPIVAGGGQISNVQITIDGETRTMVGTELVFDGLQSKLDYVLNYTYDIVEPTRTLNARGSRIAFDTGKIPPTIEHFRFLERTGSALRIDYSVLDVDEAVVLLRLKYGPNEILLDEGSGIVEIDDYEKGKSWEYQLEVEYDYATIIDKVYMLSSEVITLMIPKTAPTITTFEITSKTDSEAVIHYEVDDPDSTVASLVIGVNGVDTILPGLSGDFTFDQLSKGVKYEFTMKASYSLIADTLPAMDVSSSTLQILDFKTTPSITKFEFELLENNGIRVDYAINDPDSALSSIVLVIAGQTIPLTELSGIRELSNLDFDTEYEVSLTVSYKRSVEGAVQQIVEEDVFSFDAPLNETGVGMVIGIVGGSGLAIAGGVLFFLLRRKKVM